MEKSISGFKQEGGWVTIVEHGERMTAALRDIGVSGEDFEEWDEWRPKTHERFSEDINEKTAEQASIAEGDGENPACPLTKTSKQRARNLPRQLTKQQLVISKMPSAKAKTPPRMRPGPLTQRDAKWCGRVRKPSINT